MKGKLNIGIQLCLKPHADFLWQQLRDHQVPGKELHNQRHVAEQFDIQRTQTGEKTVWNGT